MSSARSHHLLLVFAGGAAGSLARWAISLGFESHLALLVANVLGACLLGFLSCRLLSDATRAAVCTGALGGFTSFSSLAQLVSVDALMGTGELTGGGATQPVLLVEAVAYAAVSIAGGLLGAYLGMGKLRRAAR